MDTIYGNLKGLKPSQLKQLRRLYHQRLPGDCLTTPEFAQRLAAVSVAVDEPVCAYLNRRGQVIRVGVGPPHKTQFSPRELPRYGAERLSGIRCVATQLKQSDRPPNSAALTALVMQRLDALVLLGVSDRGFERRGGGATGYVTAAHVAHLVSEYDDAETTDNANVTDSDVTKSPNQDKSDGQISTTNNNGKANSDSPVAGTTILSSLELEELDTWDFVEFVGGLEEEFRREFIARQVEGDRERVLLVGLQTDDVPDLEFSERMEELGRLVDTAGGEVIETILQRRSRAHPQTVIGSGKVQDLALASQRLGANLIVFDRDLSPVQARNVETATGIRAVDRTEIILDIFAQRARSGEGKLQVELAQLEYQLPRLVGRGQAMSRLGGGIGTRGPGETKLETERRAIQRRIAKLQRDVNQLQAHRSRLRQRRQKRDLPVVAIIGYTNAGKSTLINALTDAETYAADQLFATLDPTTRRLTDFDATTQKPVQLMLVDTVGFIQNLPPPLVDAFRATLEEVTDADALLHLVDLSHPAWNHQIDAVNVILESMDVVPGPSLLAFNKIDAISSETLDQAKIDYPDAAFVAARDRLGLKTLRQRLTSFVQRN
ncbi:MAG: GTPase HflX [Cyanobacteria bacterium P01_D01_bin.73]